MAIPISVGELLLARRVESTRIEYKANWNVVLPICQPDVPINVPVNVPINVPVNVPVNISMTGQRIEQVIIANPGINRKRLAVLCGLSEKTIGRQIKQLSPHIVYRGSLKTGGYYAV